MSNAERAYIGLCVFYALVLGYYVTTGDPFQIVLWALMLLFGLVILFAHRRQRLRRGRQEHDDH